MSAVLRSTARTAVFPFNVTFFLSDPDFPHILRVHHDSFFGEVPGTVPQLKMIVKDTFKKNTISNMEKHKHITKRIDGIKSRRIRRVVP